MFKGGVGKTTICKNIAYKLTLENKKVLLIDLEKSEKSMFKNLIIKFLLKK